MGLLFSLLLLKMERLLLSQQWLPNPKGRKPLRVLPNKPRQ
jgi:hypothetical protein